MFNIQVRAAQAFILRLSFAYPSLNLRSTFAEGIQKFLTLKSFYLFKQMMNNF